MLPRYCYRTESSMSKVKHPRWLNLGCGSSFHPDWINIDFFDHDGKVIAYDLRLGIPFADCSFDVVYHSHVLEHFPQAYAARFLRECFRVLKPGGLLRVVVPNLEEIAKAYLQSIEDVHKGLEGAADRHHGMQRALLTLLTRQQNGGAMEDDALPLLPTPDMCYENNRELHHWMYDAPSLEEALHTAGFTQTHAQHYNTSLQPEILASGLDSMAGTSSTDRPEKPASLFMEAIKHADTQTNLNKSLRIAILNTTDFGGAGQAALNLHAAFRNLEHHEDSPIVSHYYTAQQKHFHQGVHLLPSPGQICIPGQHEVLLSGMLRFQQQEARALQAYHRPQGGEYFSIPGLSCSLAKVPLLQDFDIIHMHWMAGLFDPSLDMDALIGRPVVWTLHDMNPFTGGCHYSDGCRKYEDHCGACPQLCSQDEKDLSHQTWRARMEAYRQLDLHIVCPSQWLADAAAKSRLLSRFPIHVIANGHPLDVFKPLPRATVRQSMGFTPQQTVLAFTSQSLLNLRKGGQYLLNLLQELSRTPMAQDIVVLLMGDNGAQEFFTTGIRVELAGKINNTAHMAILYNVADAVIVPSLEDNLPNVVCESLACGTPVIAFAAGGIPEMLRHQETGWLAQVSNVDELVAGVRWIHQHTNTKFLRRACRMAALEAWNPVDRARDYIQLFKKIRQNTPAKYHHVREHTVPSPHAASLSQSQPLPQHVESLLLPGSQAVLEKTLNSQFIIDHYKACFQIDTSQYFMNIPHIGLYRCKVTDLVQFYPSVCGTEALYTELQKLPWYYLEDKHEYDIVKSYVQDSASVLEIGCARGAFSRKIPHASFTGLEFNTDAVAFCRNSHLNVYNEDIVSYAQKHPHEHDMVCAFQVLEHIPNPHTFLTAAVQCLKPGGILACSVPAAESFVQHVPNYMLNMPPHHVTQWSNKALTLLAKVFNLELVALIYDTLQDIHVNFYVQSLAQSMVCEELGIDHTLYDPQLVPTVAQRAHKFEQVLYTRLKNTKDRPKGHDVVALYRAAV